MENERTNGSADSPAISPRSAVLTDWVALLRISHWLKNAIAFPVVLVTGNGHEAQAWLRAGWVFIAFCAAGSAVYIVNDIFDRDADRQHPLKAQRPIPAGRIAVPTALLVAALLAVAGCLVALAGDMAVFVCVALYLFLNLLYDIRLKHIPGLDVSCVALGFVLRLAAVLSGLGDTATGLFGTGRLSLALSTFMLCAFVALCKRASEAILGPADASGVRVRPSLDGYTPEVLPRLIAGAGGLTVVAYATFAFQSRGVTSLTALGIVPVAFCLLRFASLSMDVACLDQMAMIRTDWQLAAAGGVWLVLWLV